MLALEIAAVAFAIAYLLLAIRESIWCWAAGLASVLLSLVLFYAARLYMESALQIFYVAMSVYGWQQWRSGGAAHRGVEITTWSWLRHVLAIGGILAASLAGGVVMSQTNAAFPYVDSFTTVAAIVTTYMVAKKILENWLYWFVIDGVSVFLYLARGLHFYAALFVLYLVLIVLGYRRWRAEWLAGTARGDPREAVA